MRLLLAGTDTLLISGTDHLLLQAESGSVAATGTISVTEGALATPSVSEPALASLALD